MKFGTLVADTFRVIYQLGPTSENAIPVAISTFFEFKESSKITHLNLRHRPCWIPSWIAC